MKQTAASNPVADAIGTGKDDDDDDDDDDDHDDDDDDDDDDDHNNDDNGNNDNDAHPGIIFYRSPGPEGENLNAPHMMAIIIIKHSMQRDDCFPISVRDSTLMADHWPWRHYSQVTIAGLIS